ncbi:hypothetical protein NP233_g7844 [Leucocoprinus birnbaumii]|uniref:Uncharacterized protein n=1 Tax=Leucocoprinus birnbaumii TaxID=56174 RepID=A0AAD5VTX7_9AGAR|nr:hypothetical protein NP233_g7844 [Leucocoprinus birnbaumii]
MRAETEIQTELDVARMREEDSRLKYGNEDKVYRSVNIVEGHPSDDGLRVQSAKFCTSFRQAPKSPAFYAQSVRSVYIDDLGLRSIGEQFLPMCTSLVELSYGSSKYPPLPDMLRDILGNSAYPRLQRLGIDGEPQSLGLLSGFNVPIFNQITLIELVDAGQMMWDGLESLRCLKHLLVDVRPQWKDIANRLSTPSADKFLPIVKALQPHLPRHLKHAVIMVPNYLPFLLSWIDCERHLRSDMAHTFRPIIQGQFDNRIFLGVAGHAEEQQNVNGTTGLHFEEFQNTIQHLVCISRANPPWYWVRWAEKIVQDSQFR